MEDIFGAMLALLVVIAVVFLIIRAVNLWYWKIDKRVELMQKQIDISLDLVDRIKDQNRYLRVLLIDALENKTIMVTHKKSRETKVITVSELTLFKNLSDFDLTVLRTAEVH
jgi:hypothetical protein